MSSESVARPGRVAEVRIEPMRRRHLRAVLRIERGVEHQGWSLGLYLRELSRDAGRIYVVAKIKGRIVGFGGLIRVADDGHVTTMAVDTDLRGQGVATRLMLVMVREAIESGAKALTLEVRAANEPALALYRTFGFAPAGVRKNYYSDIGEDALVMWANEVQSPDYAARLDALEAALPSPTVLEGVGW